MNCPLGTECHLISKPVCSCKGAPLKSNWNPVPVKGPLPPSEAARLQEYLARNEPSRPGQPGA